MVLVCEGHRIDFDRLPKNPIIVDAGACQGAFIDFVNKHINSEIHAIEPCESHIKKLLKKYPNIKIYNKALVGNHGANIINFHEYVGMPMWASIYDRIDTVRNHPKLKEVLNYNVYTIRIEDLFESLDINHIDYLKLDIEGSEFDVLYSMGDNMASRIHQLSIEVHKINKDYSDIENFISHVKNLGYKCHWFKDKFELWGYR